MKKLTVEWRHYDKDGTTCDRCATTGTSVKEVISKLSEELAENDVDILFTETLLPAQLMTQSNMILINGVPLELILDNASADENHCESCSCLTGAETSCRTVEHEGITYEDIPEELIRKAIMKVILQ
jgi:hypothetical protein